MPKKRANCCSRIFFSWVTPLIAFTNKHEQLKMRHLGDLEDEAKINVQIQKLEKCWQEQLKTPGPNMLTKALFNTYIGELFWLFMLKLIEVALKLLNPYIIRALVEYVKTGENQFSEQVPFWEIKNVSWLEWLTP